MLFNSIHFLLFFPIVTLLHFVLPHKVRWVWLLVASYYFYMAWNPRYALLLATSTIITFASGLLIDRAGKQQDAARAKRRQKWVVAFSFLSNLSILFFFKYFHFALDNVNAVLARVGISTLQVGFDVLLPVGISFYTFQALSYTMDVYRGDVKPERNLFKYALFVSFFSQLVAGPIERSSALLPQIHERHDFDFENMRSGLLLMLWGYFEKLVIADRLAVLVNTVFDSYRSYKGFEIAIAIVLFAVQIYCDFSGYSDIAIGAAQVLGFKLMQNFRQPYFATSIRDFWTRWHISLSTWLRDYLFTPLVWSRWTEKLPFIGKRVKKPPVHSSLMITFLVSGLWHGASWNYVVWGGLNGAYQIVGDWLKPLRKKTSKFFKVNAKSFGTRLWKILVTFSLWCFSLLFFRAPGVTDALAILRRMCAGFNPWVLFDGSLYGMGLDRIDIMIALCAIIVLFCGNALQNRMVVRDTLVKQNLLFRWVVYFLALFAVLVFGWYGPGAATIDFLYFQF